LKGVAGLMFGGAFFFGGAWGIGGERYLPVRTGCSYRRTVACGLNDLIATMDIV